MSKQGTAESDPAEPLGPDPRIGLARKLYAAWMSEQQGITLAYAWTRYAVDAELGQIWLDLAEHFSAAMRSGDFDP